MFRDEKNLKDPEQKPPASYGAGSQNVSVIGYSKTNKLITALYIVTDIIDKDEPLRNKLRTLGAEIISDTNSIPLKACSKIADIMSFLSIASAVNIISEMNGNILKKEFRELDQAIKESRDKKMNLVKLFETPSSPYSPHPNPLLNKERGNLISKGHTRIGVQKGSTLLKAIKNMSDRVGSEARPNMLGLASRVQGFDLLKKQRREDITNFIIKSSNGATITDIKNGAQGALTSCSEKTLQRELMSMIKDGVLHKTGEKRWSRYFME